MHTVHPTQTPRSEPAHDLDNQRTTLTAITHRAAGRVEQKVGFGAGRGSPDHAGGDTGGVRAEHNGASAAGPARHALGWPRRALHKEHQFAPQFALLGCMSAVGRWGRTNKEGGGARR